MRNAPSSVGEGSPRAPRNGMTEFRGSWAHPIRHGLPASRAGTDSRLGVHMDPSAEDGGGSPTALAQGRAAAHQTAQQPAAPQPAPVPEQRTASRHDLTP